MDNTCIASLHHKTTMYYVGSRSGKTLKNPLKIQQIEATESLYKLNPLNPYIYKTSYTLF